MATEAEKLYTDTTTENTTPAAAPTDTTTPATAETPAAAVNTGAIYKTGNQTLDNYNQTRMDQIDQMYAAQKDSALKQLESAHNINMSERQAARDKITPKYQESRNEAGATYERQRRNDNLQAAMNGLNTGAGSQMRLSASNAYQSGQAQLLKAENEALAEADRGMLTLGEQYQADVAKALSDNDAQKAAAYLSEYSQQYERMMDEAKQMAAYGDFSLYAALYGQEAAAGMQRSWDLQNPALAYALGRITADEYFKMTGKYPPGYGGGGGGSSGGGGGGYYGGNGGDEPPTEKYNLTTQDLYTLEATGASEKDIQNFINNNASNPTEASAAYKKVLQGQLNAGEAMWDRGSKSTATTTTSKNTTTNKSSGNVVTQIANKASEIYNSAKSAATSAAKSLASTLNKNKTKF